ncbi:MAG: GH92 family glycosyl hydrolase, partial [bacterium]|nr:GH92 family glycosyl hydrolase [Candidatus Colisoma equi]
MKRIGMVVVGMLCASTAFGDLAEYVNPFIGTDGPGHSHPAASCPFGMVQAGPDTGTLAWDYCSGYQYRDKAVLGYSQNHLNGTGCPDFGDIQVLPFSGRSGAAGVRALPLRCAIDKSTEKASPGWYEVRQPDDGVKVEISATARAALYRFTWDKGRTPQVLVNLPFMLEETWTHSAILGSDVKTVGATVIKGSVDKTGWLKRKVSFVLEFNRPWKRLDELPRDSKAPRYVASFDESDGNVVMMRVAISHHELVGAERNLAAEMPGWDIEGVRAAARRAWNDLFERSVCEGTDEEKTNWYTSLYHLYLQPNVYSDVGEEEHYTTLSLWDTARAAHPWYSLVTPDLNDKVIASLRTLYRRDGYLPSLAYGGGNGGGMVGFHSIPVLVDWALKNRGRQDCQDKDLEEIFAAVKATLTVKHPKRSKEDWDIYDRYGYYPYDLIRGESVSRTMECAYDDWCAAQLAKALGKDGDADFFMKRSSRWRNVIDTSIGLARGKDTKGRWRDPFDPYAFGHGADTANDFTECNAFQYTWHVLHDVEGLATAFGGADRLAEKMDAIFSLPEIVRGPGLAVDVSGLIGQYVHGNEPCHHIPYFYPQLGHPEKAAERIRQICDKFYRPKPDGLCGNDDCGQMSAWYL